jgi:hypothetical protein
MKNCKNCKWNYGNKGYIGKCCNKDSPKYNIPVGKDNLCDKHNSWVIMDCPVLEQKIAFSMTEHRVKCKDGVEYTLEEVKKLDKITPEVHMVKKTFKGAVA